ncbi:MAG: hypothetical protein Q8K85_11250, partial [Hyphomicrobium sp.]|nr:hypothetical protein [Hyphomicrobium sp.]
MRDVWSPVQRTPDERYDAMCANFRWDVPDTFNFATDVIDRWAAERDSPALIWQNAAGEERTFSYSELSRLSCKFANVLKA